MKENLQTDDIRTKMSYIIDVNIKNDVIEAETNSIIESIETNLQNESDLEKRLPMSFYPLKESVLKMDLVDDDIDYFALQRIYDPEVQQNETKLNKIWVEHQNSKRINIRFFRIKVIFNNFRS
ncbi:hypothetical protein M9Y10_005719 [Tritrichomonas musculus]|uniref:Uncharacterized protein n=1 Tax=Tritrichomonas musculus TaxID=1915356 RepID=A0ABR2JDC4_9EUKA